MNLTQIPQRLLGPLPFPLDRMFAILGVLLEENDVDTRPDAPEYRVPGEYTEMEISRTAAYAQVGCYSFYITDSRLNGHAGDGAITDAPTTPHFSCR